jgi:hypothetical protein
MSEDVFPHLYRYQFLAALAARGPADKAQRRFLMILTAMADHWSLVAPEPAMMASLFSIRVNTARDWIYQFHEDRYLSDIPESEDLALLHLPEGSAAYDLVQPSFEWHTRSNAPIGGFSRGVTTHVKAQSEDGPIPLTARALQLAAGSAGKTKRGQFAYISFIQHALLSQPPATEGLSREWDRYLEGR